MKRIFTLMLCAGIIFQATATINQIRWGSTGDPLNGLTITWSNSGAKDSIKWGYTTAYEKGKFSGTSRAGYNTGISFFKYTFPTVTASTTIYYSLYDSGTHAWGSQKTFGTSPPLNSINFTFCALGDCRDYPSTLTTISNLVSARKPALTLFNGDLTVSGTTPSEYDTFFSASSNFLANNLVYHAEGNHDAASPSTFSNLWDLPVTSGTNLYYSTIYGNAIFITINSCDPTNSAQLTWLQNTLAAAAANPAITWKIVSCHHPFFNTGNHTGDMDAYRSTIWKAFDDYGVDLIMNGHDHNYQRSKPINLNAASVGTPVAQYGSNTGQGRCEIISGGAGAGLYSLNTSSADAWAINNYNKNYNYVTCNVQGCKMVITAYNQTDGVIETFNLDKTAYPPCNATGIPSTAEKFNPISVFPNPVENTFTLHYDSELTGPAVIKIFDMNGKEVATEKVNKTSQKFEYKYDLSKHAKGIYTVSIIMGTQKDNAIVILK
ncbi:MAG: metallophosphoesterase [Bacteroidia bacterium]